MSITMTEAAMAEITKVMQIQKMSADNYALRVGVMANCSGVLQHTFGFEKKEDGDPLNDVTYNFGGLETRTDRFSDKNLDGTSIDFYEDLDRRGFVFNNPNSSKGGGCGSGGCGSGGCGH